MADKTVAVRIIVRANQFSSGLRKASGDTQRFATDVERATQRAGSSAVALGAASATAGKLMLVGIGGAMAVSAKAAIDFESSLIGVAKTTDLAGSAFAKANSPLAAFGEGIRALSMRIPVNANDLARLAELGGQLGIEVPNLLEFTEVMANLGVATNMGADEAATGLARFTNIMGTGQDQFERLGSIVVDLGNNLATTESEILTFGLRLAPIGASVGLTEEEVLGLAGALTQLGIPAERGGTALQRFFLDMKGAVDSGGDSLESFASAARVSVDEFVEAFERSPAEAFQMILKGLNDIEEEGGSAAGVLSDIGVIQQRSIQVLLAASNGWESVGDAIGIANEAGAEGTALQEEAARRYGSSASQIQLLSNAFNDLRIEVGNALLGSGGLAAGLDFLREFIRIIKDNLPMMGRLVGVLAAVAGIRIGAGLISGMVEAVTQLKTMRTAAFGASKGMAALRLGMLGVNTAVFGAIAVVAILATKWASAAAEAAALNREVTDLQEQINAGADPVDAFVGKLEEMEIITGDNRDLLHDAGISEREFAKALLEGGDAVDEINDKFRDSLIAREEYQRVLESGGPVPAPEFLFGKEAAAFRELVDAAEELQGGFIDKRVRDIRNALIEAGLGARFTADEIKGIAEAAAESQPFDRDPGDIASSIAGFDGFGETVREGEALVAGMEKTNERASRSWKEMVLGLEEGEGRIDDFYESMGEGAQDFQNTLTDSFEEVRDAIMGGFPTWDEYEQVSVESFQAVLDAQNLYLEDLADGFELESELAGQVSGRVMEFIEGLDPATKGALARWRRTNKTEFEAWIDEVGDNLDEAGGLTNDFWELELPAAQEAGFATLFGQAVQQAKAFELPGEQTAQAIMDGLMETMGHLTEEQQADFMGFISNIFQDEAFLESIGLDIGNPIVQGILEALGALPDKAGGVIREGARKVSAIWDDEYEVSSPSKMTLRVGRELTRGLFVGMEDEFDRQLRATNQPVANIVTPNPTVNVNVPETGGSRDIHIYYPQHTENDISDAIQKSSFLGSIQRVAETTPGNN